MVRMYGMFVRMYGMFVRVCVCLRPPPRLLGRVRVSSV